MAWIVEYEYPEDGEHSTQTFSTREDAYRYALVQAEDRIQDSWNLEPGEDDREKAIDFNDRINAGDYKQALYIYNDVESDRDYGMFYYVSESIPQDFGTVPSGVDIPPEEEDDDDYDDDDADEEDDEPYLASDVGANCRGPCGNYYPDAYADRRDGTIECYQCRSLKSIFGPN